MERDVDGRRKGRKGWDPFRFVNVCLIEEERKKVAIESAASGDVLVSMPISGHRMSLERVRTTCCPWKSFCMRPS